MDKIIDGVIVSPLKQIFHPKGNVFHGMKKSDSGYNGFEEAYFSMIHFNDIKPWKKHLRMTLNFVVPVGAIRFVLYDDREGSITKGVFNDFILSTQNYCRLTIPHGIWVAFKGLSEDLNLLLNIANLEHSPEEIERIELNDIKYNWE
jgi:dTDP-4-dehydrorhamnose 3,5-epimerase